MEKIFEQALLYDFYGELLNSHQRSIYEDVVYHDMSLGEIAEEHGISRQGVHDLIKRCDRILQDYENRLHLVERFVRAKDQLREINELAQGVCGDLQNLYWGNALPGNPEGGLPDGSAAQSRVSQSMERIRVLAEELIQEL